jgi:hypothetical protein
MGIIPVWVSGMIYSLNVNGRVTNVWYLDGEELVCKSENIEPQIFDRIHRICLLHPFSSLNSVVIIR